MRSRHKRGIAEAAAGVVMCFRTRHALLDIPLLTHGEVECEFLVQLSSEFVPAKECAKTRDPCHEGLLSLYGFEIQHQRNCLRDLLPVLALGS